MFVKNMNELMHHTATLLCNVQYVLCMCLWYWPIKQAHLQLKDMLNCSPFLFQGTFTSHVFWGQYFLYIKRWSQFTLNHFSYPYFVFLVSFLTGMKFDIPASTNSVENSSSVWGNNVPTRMLTRRGAAMPIASVSNSSSPAPRTPGMFQQGKNLKLY